MPHERVGDLSPVGLILPHRQTDVMVCMRQDILLDVNRFHIRCGSFHAEDLPRGISDDVVVIGGAFRQHAGLQRLPQPSGSHDGAHHQLARHTWFAVIGIHLVPGQGDAGSVETRRHRRSTGRDAQVFRIILRLDFHDHQVVFVIRQLIVGVSQQGGPVFRRPAACRQVGTAFPGLIVFQLPHVRVPQLLAHTGEEYGEIDLRPRCNPLQFAQVVRINVLCELQVAVAFLLDVFPGHGLGDILDRLRQNDLQMRFHLLADCQADLII